MTEDKLRVIQKYYCQLSEFIQQKESLLESQSIDEAHAQHEIKKNETETELKTLTKK